MKHRTTVAIDVMGGDHGPEVILAGANESCQRNDDVRFLLVGAEDRIRPIIDEMPVLKFVSEIVNAETQVAMDARPSQALRSGRRHSSMWKAIETVKLGQADVVVSAGNTGALMAMSKIILKTMPGTDRPAIAAIWPTLRGRSIILDAGATIGADAQQLVDFAVMGEAMSRSVFNIERPIIGLLNVGVEEIKGNDDVKAAGAILRETELPIEYHGFIEGDDIGSGLVDVVVTEGFSGNIALKTAEGTARQIAQYLREAMTRNILCKLGYLLASGGFAFLANKMDPRKYNGGVLLGLNGIVVKSHGSTDSYGFANAVDLSIDIVRSGMHSRIARDMERVHLEQGQPDIQLAATGSE